MRFQRDRKTSPREPLDPGDLATAGLLPAGTAVPRIAPRTPGVARDGTAAETERTTPAKDTASNGTLNAQAGRKDFQ